MGAPSPDVIRAIARERGQPEEAVAAEYGVMMPHAEALPSPAEVPPPAFDQPVIRTIEPAPPQEMAPVDVPPPPQAAPPPPPPTADLSPKALGAAMGELGALSDADAAAATRIGEAEAASADREVAARAALVETPEERAAADKAEANATANARAADEKLRKLNEEIAASPEIRDRRTGSQRVWGAISLALAGWSEGLAGAAGMNNNAVAQAQGVIQQSVERDIAMQEKNLAQKGKNRDAAKDELSLAIKAVGDTKEARKLAMAMRKERFAEDMEREGAMLKSATAKDRNSIVANKFKIDAAKEKLDVLKTVVGARGAAGLSPTGEAGPSSQVAGPLTKSQQGVVNMAAHQASAGPWHAKDPSKADPVQTRKVQDYYGQSRVYQNALSELESLYGASMNADLPEQDRKLATTQFGIKRDEAIAKLSVKDDQGVVTNPEFARKIESLKAPPQNVIDRGSRAWSEWWNGTTSGPEVYDAMRRSAERELGVFMDGRDWTTEGPSAPAGNAKPSKPKKNLNHLYE